MEVDVLDSHEQGVDRPSESMWQARKVLFDL